MVNFIILLILHLIGDFYLQTAKIARCKNARIGAECNGCRQCKSGRKWNSKYILFHSFLYVIPFTIVFFMSNWSAAIVLLLVLVLSHGVIDILSCCINKKAKHTLVFIADQLIHIGILFLAYKKIEFNSIFDNYYIELKVALTILILMAPCSIFINKLFEDVYPGTNLEGIFDIGSIIGILERFLVVIFAYFGNFPAIAIIITVKTWARNNDLKEKDFRNKYLLGTLASLVLALLVFILFKTI